jgi:pimeloyl-ACP methyl ester carboxylesterase
MRQDIFELYEAIEDILAAGDTDVANAKFRKHVEYFGTRHQQTLLHASQSRTNSIRHRVILVHGIRTTAAWYETAREVLSASPWLLVVTPSYGIIGLFSFAFPPLRRIPYNALAKEIKDNYAKDMVTSVVAHSYGSYLVTKFLIKNPDVRIFRLLMCGSVTSRPLFLTIKNKPHQTVHDVGMRDLFPLLANILVYGVGSAGYFGLRAGEAIDRYHDLAHDFSDSKFMNEWWLPFISAGTVANSVDSRPSEKKFGYWLAGVLDNIGEYKLIRILSVIALFYWLT